MEFYKYICEVTDIEYRETEHEEITDYVEKRVAEIIAQVHTLDPRFQLTLIPSGSHYEHSQLAPVSEFDFMLRMENFPHLELVENETPLDPSNDDSKKQHIPAGFVMLKVTDPQEREKWQDVLTDGEFMCTERMKSVFAVLIGKIAESADDIGYHTTPDYFSTGRGPAVAIQLIPPPELRSPLITLDPTNFDVVKSDEVPDGMADMVMVDLCLCLEITGWPKSSDWPLRLQAGHPGYTLHEQMTCFHIVPGRAKDDDYYDILEEELSDINANDKAQLNDPEVVDQGLQSEENSEEIIQCSSKESSEESATALKADSKTSQEVDQVCQNKENTEEIIQCSSKELSEESATALKADSKTPQEVDQVCQSKENPEEIILCSSDDLSNEATNAEGEPKISQEVSNILQDQENPDEIIQCSAECPENNLPSSGTEHQNLADNIGWFWRLSTSAPELVLLQHLFQNSNLQLFFRGMKYYRDEYDLDDLSSYVLKNAVFFQWEKNPDLSLWTKESIQIHSISAWEWIKSGYVNRYLPSFFIPGYKLFGKKGQSSDSDNLDQDTSCAFKPFDRDVSESTWAKWMDSDSGAVIAHAFTDNMTVQSTADYVINNIDKVIDNIKNFESAEAQKKKDQEKLEMNLKKHDSPFQIFPFYK